MASFLALLARQTVAIPKNGFLTEWLAFAYLLVCQLVVIEWVQSLHFRLLVEPEKMPVAHLRLPCSRIFFAVQQNLFCWAADLFPQGSRIIFARQGSKKGRGGGRACVALFSRAVYMCERAGWD